MHSRDRTMAIAKLVSIKKTAFCINPTFDVGQFTVISHWI